MQQVELLKMWDEVRTPHKRKKQVFGDHLAILGIVVDVNLLLFLLPLEVKARLEQELEKWGQKRV